VAPEAETKAARDLPPLLVLAVGLAARLALAQGSFLNPDEALLNLLASQASVGLAYRAALTTPHPPLLILALYYWRWLGQSELILRLPSVLAGTACSWVAYQWLKQVSNRSTALTGLLLFTFTPALIELSAEIRQYALVLFFMASCLYLSERALRENSWPWMILFSLSLMAALLTHYSAMIFAFTIGVYMLVRLYPYGRRPLVFAVWMCGQAAATALCRYFLVTHVAELWQSGMPRWIADNYLRSSLYHSGDQRWAVFAAAQTVRLFEYLLANGVGGVLALLAFLGGQVVLLSQRQPIHEQGPRPRELALLLGLPFLVSCGAALAGLFPYGGTRHDVFLSLFGLSGASFGLAAWRRPARDWTRPLVIVDCLALCNFLPMSKLRVRADHASARMKEAMAAVRATVPPGSIIFADDQSGLLLGYYLCGHGIVQVFPPPRLFEKSDCGPYTTLTTPQTWSLRPQEVPGEVEKLALAYQLAPGTRIWWFDAGWIGVSALELRQELMRRGWTAPRAFGENILLCPLTVGPPGEIREAGRSESPAAGSAGRRRADK